MMFMFDVDHRARHSTASAVDKSNLTIIVLYLSRKLKILELLNTESKEGERMPKEKFGEQNGGIEQNRTIIELLFLATACLRCLLSLSQWMVK